MEKLRVRYFRQSGNPTQVLTLYKEDNMFGVKLEVQPHTIDGVDPIVLVEQSYAYLSKAEDFYYDLFHYFTKLSSNVGNELDMFTGEELSED